jgi:hypothetical protein
MVEGIEGGSVEEGPNTTKCIVGGGPLKDTVILMYIALQIAQKVDTFPPGESRLIQQVMAISHKVL